MSVTDKENGPILNSYWVVPGCLAAGEYPGAERPSEAAHKLRVLLSAGINHFIDLTEPRELVPYGDIAEREAENLGVNAGYERHPIVDVSVPRCTQQMSRILDSIDHAMGDGRTVFVHCWGGVGRTGTVVGCWLVRHGRTGEEALHQIAKWWQGVEKAHRHPFSPQTMEQRKYILDWKEPLQMEGTLVREVTVRDRFRGCLLGLATGDALGTTLEFMKPCTFQPIDDMIGGGPFSLEPGQWTDDTSMALCLATSLIEEDGFDPLDQMKRYLRWWREGYLSSTGTCFDIGDTIADALWRFEDSGDPYSGSTDPWSAGNGSLMRLAPVPMFFAGFPVEAIDRSGASSRTTHGAREAVDACRYFAGLLVGALKGVEKETLLSSQFSPVERLWETKPLTAKIAEVADGSFKHKEPCEIRGSGYVVESMEAALWAFHKSRDFREGALLAANLGDDADTTAAIYGQIAGAYYGAGTIPSQWLHLLTMATEITSMADSLYEGSLR